LEKKCYQRSGDANAPFHLFFVSALTNGRVRYSSSNRYSTTWIAASFASSRSCSLQVAPTFEQTRRWASSWIDPQYHKSSSLSPHFFMFFLLFFLLTFFYLIISNLSITSSLIGILCQWATQNI
jgi:hypothetical protein